jgi:hypothetical protein
MRVGTLQNGFRCCNCTKDKGWDNYDQDACRHCKSRRAQHEESRKEAEERRHEEETARRREEERARRLKENKEQERRKKEFEREESKRKNLVQYLMDASGLKDPEAARKLLMRNNWQYELADNELLAAQFKSQQLVQRARDERELRAAFANSRDNFCLFR